MIPFKKSTKSKREQPKRDPMPNKVKGAAKRNKNGGVVRDPFSKTVTDTPDRMPTQVRGN